MGISPDSNNLTSFKIEDSWTAREFLGTSNHTPSDCCPQQGCPGGAGPHLTGPFHTKDPSLGVRTPLSHRMPEPGHQDLTHQLIPKKLGSLNPCIRVCPFSYLPSTFPNDSLHPEDLGFSLSFHY